MADPAILVAGTALQALAILACTELTVVAKIAEPLQTRLHRIGLWGDRHTGARAALARFFANAWTCWFCSSWWHAGWLVPTITWAIGGGLLAALTTALPSVGAAWVLHRLITGPVGLQHSASASKPVTSIAAALRGDR